jgi:hypothetical protein
MGSAWSAAWRSQRKWCGEPLGPFFSLNRGNGSKTKTKIMQCINRQQLLRHQLVELCILSLKQTEPPGIGDVHGTVLVTPAVKGLLRDVVAAGYIADLGARLFRLSQDSDDLFLGKELLRL